MADLGGCRLKLARANEHLKTLHEEIEWFLKRNPSPLTVQRDPKTREDLLWTLIRENPPDEWSCIVGDVLYNLRSCLDHLAWQLVLLPGNEPSTDTAFPVFKYDPFAPGAKRDLLKTWEKRSKGMDTSDIAILKRLQPYTRGDEFTDHPLFLLNEMTNWDKHQQLHLGAHHLSYLGLELDYGATKGRSEVEFTPFAPLDFRAAAIPIVRSEGHVEMQIHRSPDISFRDGPYWELRKVRETLVHLANFVTDVVNEFEPRFG